MKYLLKLLGFWIGFFTLQQIIFLLYGWSGYTGSILEALSSFLPALRLNLATAAYVTALPAIIYIFGIWNLARRQQRQMAIWVSLFFLLLSAILLCTDISLYDVWGTKVNAKALGYTQYPKELLPTVFNSQNLELFLLILAQFILGYFILTRWIITEPDYPSSRWVRFAASILIPVVLVIMFRGGFQKVPINRNQVFQYGSPVLNYGALNSFWNTADLLTHPLDKQGNPYTFFNDQEAERLSKELHSGKELNHVEWLTNQRPNIIIIFLESWAADEMECLGGETGITPRFTDLAKEGMLFTRFYSTGYRTEQGFLATLSGIPALPVGSVIQTFGKFDKLPNLYKTFRTAGYHTSFYSGGRLFFDNIEAYLRSAGVQTMKGENEWKINRRTVWGAYDEETFAMHLNELAQSPQPFFSALTTMTTHEWFDADVPKRFTGDETVNDNYRNTLFYSDSCLYAYLQQAKSQPWYANTLFVIVADHSCKFPKGRSNFETERHHIPLLILGGALKPEFKNTRNNRIGSHVDLPRTLLNQTSQSSALFPWSKDLCNNGSPEFAYYAFDNGFGYIDPKGYFLYDHNRRKMTDNSMTDSVYANQKMKQVKGYLQTQFKQNLDIVSSKPLQ